jgi:hypothetical protein
MAARAGLPAAAIAKAQEGAVFDLDAFDDGQYETRIPAEWVPDRPGKRPRPAFLSPPP